MRALSLLALVAALCGYYVSVMSRFFKWFLPVEQARTDRQVYRRSLYRGPIPTWMPRRATSSARRGAASFSFWRPLEVCI